ncbi:MAG: hypothetical protein IPK58_20075 [Acidobacteria bacterium]|nr:hypothetical protein [Acidobacteriota bacterium]
MEDELERLKRDADTNCDEVARLDRIVQERRRVVASMDLALERAKIFEDNGLTDEANRIRSAVNAFGKPGQDNGVVVARDLDTADEGGYTHVKDGTIIVAFNMEQLNEQNVAHEGVHVQQASRYLNGTNISLHDAEMEAYTVSALVSETNVGIFKRTVEGRI